MKSNLQQLFKKAFAFFEFKHFDKKVEKQYVAYRYRTAEPIIRFAFYIGGFITTLLTAITFLSGQGVDIARWAYIGTWAALLILGTTRKLNIHIAYSLYLCISSVFFVYYRYYLNDMPMYIVPTINLLLAGLLVAQLGSRFTTMVAFFVPISSTLIFASTGDFNPVTMHIMVMMWLSAIVFWLGSIIIESVSRSAFYYQHQLTIAKKKETDAHKAKTEFLASMSHEIRTPLTAIIGYAQSILVDNINPTEQLDLIRRVKTNGDHLLRLVNDILDLSKIEQGKLTLNPEEVPLFELLRDTRFSTENLAQKKRLRYEFKYEFPLPKVVIVDRVRLQQVLVNLLANAIKFTEQGHVELTTFADEHQIFFKVEDSGIGINKEAEKRIFEVFEQESADITRRFGGSGLGLAISRKLTQMMGGDLMFHSEEGKGTTFIVGIALQLPDGTAWLDAPDEIQAETKFLLSQSQFNGKVLIVDDVTDNRKLISIILNRAGVETDEAENGEIALEKALVSDYDLILMDIQMPVLNGIEAVQQLRAFGNRTPVIALTANVMEHEVKQYLEMGFNAHLGKPINRMALSRELARYLQKGEKAEQKTTYDSEFLVLKEKYITKLKSRIPEITALIEKRDFSELSQLAHSIKGSAGSFEFPILTELASKIEPKAENQEEEALELTKDLVQAIEQQSK